ncbi:MAG TPA: hypothetical protein VGH28_27235 [Polyangiaceae bacterium]|jgi:hypothetical protein
MKARALTLAAVVLLAPAARAQGNYRSAALGGRSALMGDSGIALGTDGAAPFLNPATVTHVESTLAVSVSFLSVDITHAANWYAPGADITRVSGNAIPSTFCLFFDLPRLFTPDDKSSDAGNQKLATCFGTTELQSFDWVGQGFQSGGAIQTSSVRWGWQRFVVGPSYAANVTRALAIGAAVQGAFTNFSSFASVGSTATDGSSSSVFEDGSSGSDFGLSAILGATLTLGHFTIGATVQSPDVSVYGHGNLSTYIASSTAGSSMTYFGQGSFHGREPTRFGLGLGYEWPRGTIELDGQLALADGSAVQLDTNGTQLATPGAALTATEVDRNTRFQPTLNASLGAELYVRPTLSILAGFATDFSAVDGIASTGVAPSRENRLLASFGIGSHSDAGTVIVGAQAYYGWGQMLGYASAPTVAPIDIQSTGVLLVLAGATNFKSIERAVQDVRGIVRPRRTP